MCFSIFYSKFRILLSITYFKVTHFSNAERHIKSYVEKPTYMVHFAKPKFKFLFPFLEYPNALLKSMLCIKWTKEKNEFQKQFLNFNFILFSHENSLSKMEYKKTTFGISQFVTWPKMQLNTENYCLNEWTLNILKLNKQTKTSERKRKTKISWKSLVIPW